MPPLKLSSLAQVGPTGWDRLCVWGGGEGGGGQGGVGRVPALKGQCPHRAGPAGAGAEHAGDEGDVPQLRGDVGQHRFGPRHDPSLGGHQR